MQGIIWACFYSHVSGKMVQQTFLLAFPPSAILKTLLTTFSIYKGQRWFTSLWTGTGPLGSSLEWKYANSANRSTRGYVGGGNEEEIWELEDRDGVFKRRASLLRAGPPARVGDLRDGDICRNGPSQHTHLCLWVDRHAWFRRHPPLQFILLFYLHLLIVIFWLCCMGKAKGQNVCLLGLSDSGKTLLYLRVELIIINMLQKYFEWCIFTDHLWQFYEDTKLHQGEWIKVWEIRQGWWKLDFTDYGINFRYFFVAVEREAHYAGWCAWKWEDEREDICKIQELTEVRREFCIWSQIVSSILAPPPPPSHTEQWFWWWTVLTLTRRLATWPVCSMTFSLTLWSTRKGSPSSWHATSRTSLWPGGQRPSQNTSKRKCKQLIPIMLKIDK